MSGGRVREGMREALRQAAPHLADDVLDQLAQAAEEQAEAEYAPLPVEEDGMLYLCQGAYGRPNRDGPQED